MPSLTQLLLEHPDPVFSPHPAGPHRGPKLFGPAGFGRPALGVADAARVPSRQVCGWEALTGGNRLRRALGSLWHRCQGRRETPPCAPSSYPSQPFRDRGRELGAVHLNPTMSSVFSSDPGRGGCDPGGQHLGLCSKAHVWGSTPLPTMRIYYLTTESTGELCTDDK